MKKKDFRLNYIIDDIAKNITPEEPVIEDKNDLYNIGGQLKPHINYSVDSKEDVPSIEDNTAEEAKSLGQKAAEATIDAASEETGSNLWDTIIKGV